MLVPLAAKGYVKRDEALPYIMGANITTLADTLVVAMLQPAPVAAQIVLAEAIGVTIVSLIILAFFFQPVKTTVLRLDDCLVASNRRLASSWAGCSSLRGVPGVGVLLLRAGAIGAGRRGPAARILSLRS